MRKSGIDARIRICRRCPLHTLKDGHEICNPNLYVNPSNDDISLKRKGGYVKGCGCVLDIKVTHDDEHCIAGKW